MVGSVSSVSDRGRTCLEAGKEVALGTNGLHHMWCGRRILTCPSALVGRTGATLQESACFFVRCGVGCACGRLCY